MFTRALFIAFASALLACSGTDKPTVHDPSTDEVVAPATIDAAPAPEPEAAEPLDVRCANGDVGGCDGLLEYWSERQVPTDDNVAKGKADATALHTGCDDHGVSSACMALAMMYKYGTITGARDKDTSNTYWGRVAELGDLNGFRGAEASEAGAAALAATHSECQAGRSRACNQAGWAAFSAVQQDKDVGAAFEYYAKGCDLGSGQGCAYAGHFAYTYPDETGAADRAQQLLTRGCDLGSPGACDELGLYVAKHGRSDEARPRYRSACDAGARAACYHLAKHLADAGAGPDEVVPLFEMACKAGDKSACKALQDKGP